MPRHSSASGPLVTNGAHPTRGEGEQSDTIHVQTPRLGVFQAPITPKPSTIASSNTASSTGGMDDISLTSPPSVVQSPKKEIKSTKTTKRKRAPAMPQSAPRPLAAKPGTTKGSENNPIDLDEYTPRSKPVRLMKRRYRGPLPEPHQFVGQHQELFVARPPRNALAPKPANGVRFTGEKGDDMYRMISAKMTAVGLTPPVQYMAPPVQMKESQAALKTPIVQNQAMPGQYQVSPVQYQPPHAQYQPPPAQYQVLQPAHYQAPPAPYQVPPTAYTHIGYNLPFETQYPISALYLSQSQPPAPTNSPYAQYHSHMGVSLTGDTEPTLRKKALQHIRESARPQQRLRKVLSDDVDETSGDDEDPTPARNPRKFTVYQDANDQISPLIVQTSLLTSLLQVYEKSADQGGLREDIGMLVGVLKKGVGKWVGCEAEAEKEAEKKKDEDERKRDDAERRKDEEVRGLLSAGAEMWGDGTEGVVEVFGGEGGAEFEVVAVRAGSDEGRMRGVCGWRMKMVE